MAGRNKKPAEVSTGKIGKDAKAHRLAEEERVKLGRESLVAPEWLSFEAQIEFNRVVDEAGQIGLLDNLDLSVLSIYCNAYYCYIELTKKIQSKGFGTRGASSTDISKQEKYVKQILQCSAKLGLATTDRLKIIVPAPKQAPKNKFEKYIQ